MHISEEVRTFEVSFTMICPLFMPNSYTTLIAGVTTEVQNVRKSRTTVALFEEEKMKEMLGIHNFNTWNNIAYLKTIRPVKSDGACH